MNRRAFIGATVGFLAAPLAAEAQQAGKVPTIGIIYLDYPPVRSPAAALFWESMRQLGWVEGQNVEVEYRNAGGAWNRVTPLAAELVARSIDVFVVSSEGIAQSIQRATRTTPICVYASDVQVAGLVKSLARPEQNVTGVQSAQIDLAGKRLAVLKEVVPRLTRVGVLVEEQWHPSTVALLRNTEDAARVLGLRVHIAEALVPTRSKERSPR